MPKRGTDHTWQLVKYNGDGAIYVRCKCKHHYNCGRRKINEDGSWSPIQVPTIFYPYCPMCGAKKKWQQRKLKELINTNLMTFRREKI